MIVGVVGYPGEGKTMFLAKIAWEKAERYRSMPKHKRRKVFTTFPVFHDDIEQFDKFEDMQNIANADIFVQECWRWFGSRSSMEKSRLDLMSTWCQARHDGVNVWWDSQNPEQIDRQIREDLTTWVWRMRRITGPDQDGAFTKFEEMFGAWTLASKYEAATFGTTTKERCWKRTLVKMNDWFDRYDTNWVSGDREGGARTGRAQAQAAGAPGVLPSLPKKEIHFSETGANSCFHLASGLDLPDDRVIDSREEYLRGVSVDEMGRVVYAPSLELVLDDYRKGRKSA